MVIVGTIFLVPLRAHPSTASAARGVWLLQILQSDATTCIAEVGVVVRPHSLLAAMALQLGSWLETGDDRMLNAVLPWAFGPGTGNRVSRQYCSTKCRDAARYKKHTGGLWEVT